VVGMEKVTMPVVVKPDGVQEGDVVYFSAYEGAGFDNGEYVVEAVSDDERSFTLRRLK
jgi:co-chaperonin GroES (HSP10)